MTTLNVRSESLFLFGDFVVTGFAKLSIAPVPGFHSIAIQILREFSAQEFIGKVFIRGNKGEWSPLHPAAGPNYDWFRAQQDNRNVMFKAAGSSGTWDVLHFRGETDNVGIYTAVALRQTQKKGLKKLGER